MIPAAGDFEIEATAFDGLSAASLDRLVAIGRTMTFGVGAMVLHEGRETPFLGLVETGRVALRLRAPEQGHRLSIMTIEPGQLLGWSALVPPYRATVDAIATEPTTLLAIDAAVLRTEVARNSGLALELLPTLLRTVSERLAASWHQLLDLLPEPIAEPW